MYFECNLPRKVPGYYNPALLPQMQACVERVRARHLVLDSACDLAAARGMRAADFHRAAKKLFDAVGPETFDAYSAEDVNNATKLLYDGDYAPDRIDWPNATVLFDTAFVVTADWEMLRHLGVGGSDASVLMGLSPYQSSEGLFYDKTGAPKLVDNDSGKRSVFDRGHFLEPVVVETFCKLTGAEVIPETRMFASKKNPQMTANIDAVIRMASGKLALFEAKTAMDVYSKVSQWFGDSVPAYYLCQTQQYLEVMDDDRLEGCYIAMLPTSDHDFAGVYIGSDIDRTKLFHKFIERDLMFGEELREVIGEFWQNHIIVGVKPAPSKNGELDKAVAAMYRPSPMSDPKAPAVELPFSELEDTVNRLADMDAQIKEVEGRLEVLKNARDAWRTELTDAMGAAQEATLVAADGTPVMTIKNKLVTRTSVDTKTLEEVWPDVYAQVKMESAHTRFLTKMLKKK